MKKLIITCAIFFISLFVSGQIDEIEFISEGITLNTYLYKGKGSEVKPDIADLQSVTTKQMKQLTSTINNLFL